MITELIEKVVKADVITARKFCGGFAEDSLPREIERYPLPTSQIPTPSANLGNIG
jgi:hypothetical protein